MRRRARATSVLPHLSARRVVGAGVAVAVPAAGGMLASAPAVAAPGGSTSGTTATPSTARPVLAYGARNATVRIVQAKVGVAVDGIFGPATAAAVKRFQSANGLVPDGIVGKLTWAAIDGGGRATAPSAPSTPSTPRASTTPSTSPATCASVSTTTLRSGARSQLVKVLQGRLGITADGIFGPATYAAVTNFQRANGLVVDGIVGNLTWAKLGCTGPSASTTPVSTTQPSSPIKTTPISTVPVSTTPGTTTTISADAIIAYAKQFTGTAYLWGGSSPAGFDCSGLTSYVYAHFGIKMPRTAAQQQAYFPGTTTPKPGDLLFFGYPAYHVAIYLGNGMMLDAPHPGGTVGVRSIYATPTSYARVLR